MTINSTNIIGVIPARYASQRLPAKPLLDLEGKPMIRRVYEQVARSRLVGRVVVATDDERIAAVVRGFGGEAVMTSPELRSGTDRVAAAAELLSGDIFVNIQGDEPLIVPEMIDEAVDVLLRDRECPMGTLARVIDRADDLTNPSVTKVVIDHAGRALYFSRSPIPHVRDGRSMEEWLAGTRFLKHIGLYVYRRDFLAVYAKLPEAPLERAEKLEQLRPLSHGYRIAVGITRHDSVPVDTPADAERVRKLLREAEGKA